MNNDNAFNTDTMVYETPESAISSLLRTINAKEALNKMVTIKGTISKITPAQNATFATLTGNAENASIRLFTSSREGNQNLLDSVWEGNDYLVSGRLSVYNNGSQLNLQLIPVSITPFLQKENSSNQNDKLTELNNLIPPIIKRRNKELSIATAIENAVAMKSIVKVALVRPHSDIPQGDINSGLQNLRDKFNIVPFPCNFTNPQDIANALMRADNTTVDFVIFSRGGGENLYIVDNPKVLETLLMMKKPVITGLGHDKEHHLADIIAETSCSVPFHVGCYLRELYIRKQQEQSKPRWREEDIPASLKKRLDDVKFAVRNTPCFYGLKWTAKDPVRYTIYGLILIGLYQIISIFI